VRSTGVALALLIEEPLDHRGDRRELVGGGAAGDHSEGCGCVIRSLVRWQVAHRGIFPCFFAGCDSRLVRSARSALITTTRVAAGSMMPSSSPRSAARNGDATL
jgi:hypothetical protein